MNARHWKRLSAGLLLGLVALVLVFAVQRVQQRLQPVPAQGRAAPVVEVLTLAPGRFELRADYTGSVAAGQTAKLPAQVGARVVKIHRREGESFRKGEVLISLDDRELRNEVRRLEASGRRLRAELDYWTRQNARNLKLWDKRVISQSQLDESRRMVDSLTASLDENAEALANARIRLGQTRILAPFDGRVQRLMTEVGDQTVPLLKSLIEVVATGRLKAVVAVPQADLERLSTGLAVDLRIPAAGVALRARIDRIYPVLDAGTRNATFEICLSCLPEVPAAALYPGMALNASVVLEARDAALAVPHQALREIDGVAGVFLYRDGTARWRPVTPGAVAGGEVLILDGLQAGDQVIVTPDTRLADGVAVGLAGSSVP